MLQRVLEEGGLTTVSISLVREHTEKIKPPRALFVPFPFGAPFGAPGAVDQQHSVLRAALDLLKAPDGPVLCDFPDAEAGEMAPSPVQAAAVDAGEPELDVATEVSMMRRYHELWVEREGKTAVGLTRVSPVRFRGIVRFLEAFADGVDGDMRERPRDLAMPNWIRYCVDDLKAMYLEGRMAMKADEPPEAAGRWLWGETALGPLVVRVRDRMEASEDGRMKEAGFGIAR